MNTRVSSLTHLASRPRGGSIFIAMVMLGIMSITILAMLQYAMYQQRMTHRRVEREAVYYAAEAGVDQVVHYFNFPAEYGNQTLFTTSPDTDTYYTLGGANVFSTRSISEAGAPLTFSDPTLVFGYEAGDGVDRARVTELSIALPNSEDLAAFDQAVLAVTSQGQNDAGQTRIVRAILTSEPPFLLKIPAPLISLQGHNANGQLNVHWGEAWFKNDFNLPASGGLNSLPSVSEDPWFNLRTEGIVLLSNGTPAPSGTALQWPADGGSYFQPWLGIDSERINIWQHAADPNSPAAPPEFPDPLDYEFWKDVAQARGLYFSWNADGTRLVQGTNGAEIRANEFMDMINTADEVVTGANGESQSLPPPQIIFVDTLDGNEPNGIPHGEPGSNLCELSLTGGGETFLRGVLYVGGDVRMNISGTADIWIQDPERVADSATGSEIQLNDLFMSGLFYCEGVMTAQGSQNIYGALFARGGFGGSGGHDVYYDARLGQGLPLSINSAVTVARLVELSPDIQIAGL